MSNPNQAYPFHCTTEKELCENLLRVEEAFKNPPDSISQLNLIRISIPDPYGHQNHDTLQFYKDSLEKSQIGVFCFEQITIEWRSAVEADSPGFNLLIKPNDNLFKGILSFSITQINQWPKDIRWYFWRIYQILGVQDYLNTIKETTGYQELQDLARQKYLDLANLHRDLTHQLQQDFDKKEKKREDDENERVQHYAAKEKTLKEEYQEKHKAVDIQEPRDKRRKVVEGLKEDLKKAESYVRFSKSHWVMIAVYAVLLGLIATANFDPSLIHLDKELWSEEGVGPIYKILLRILLAGSFLGIAIMFLRWIQRLQHMNDNQIIRERQLYIDMLRCELVSETIFDWLETKKRHDDSTKEIPPQLLESYTRNLFSHDKETHPEVTHPMEDVLKSITGLKKVTVGNVSVER
jgi:hypothetical protein